MRMYLVTGSLGSGKTTVIISLVEALKDKEFVYIVNDAGTVAFDAAAVHTPSTERLLAGCVCCEDVYSLTKTLHKVQEKQPNATVIVEPSGLANPSQILDAVKILGMDFIHIHVINAELDSIVQPEMLHPSAFILNRFGNETELQLWQQSTTQPVVPFQPGASTESLLHLEPLSSLMLCSKMETVIHHGLFIKNLLVPPEREYEFLVLLEECSSNGILQRAKGKLSTGCVSASSSGVTLSEDLLYEELPDGVMLVVGDASLDEVFCCFDISNAQLELLLEAYRNISVLRKASNLNSEGQLLVASDCDRAYFITHQLADQAIASKLREDAFQEMLRWRLVSMSLLDSCVGSREEKLFWEHSLSAALGYILGLYPEDVSDDHLEKILELVVYRRYFVTMEALHDVECTNFTPPFQHDKKPWPFWEMMRAKAVQYGEMDAVKINQIVKQVVGTPFGNEEAEHFYNASSD